MRELKWAILAFVLSPLSLFVSVPLFYMIGRILHGQPVGALLQYASVGIMALILGSGGFVVCGAPLYFGLRWLRRWPFAGMAFASVTGFLAALLILPINDLSYGMPETLIYLAYHPADWIDGTSLGGALAGLLFWYLTRRGFSSPHAELVEA